MEDHPDAGESLRDLLEVFEHVVQLAVDGPSGLAQARTFRPDVILCDIGLPGIDGYQLAQLLRADPLTAGITLIALTGYGQPEDRRRAGAAGFDGHFVKPLDVEVLLGQLAEIVPHA